MWFEVILICCAGVILMKADAKCQTADNEAKTHTVVCFLTPILFIVLYGRTFFAKELLVGLNILFILAFCKQLNGISDKTSKTVAYLIKGFLCILLYILVIKNYIPDEHSDEMSREEAYIIFAGISLLLIFSDRIKRNLTAYIWILATLVPVLGFYIMERAFNTNLDMMSWKYVTGNILCLFCLLVILYSFMRKKAAIGLFLTICLAFGVANYYVGMFRGSPVMPSDLLSAGTAFQVAGGYEFEISEQVAVSVLFWYAGIAVLCCLPKKLADQRWKMKVAVDLQDVKGSWMKKSIRLLREYPDAWLIIDVGSMQESDVTEKLGLFVKTAENLESEVLERTILQVYSEKMFYAVADISDWSCIVYHINNFVHFSEKDFITFAYREGIKVIAGDFDATHELFVHELLEHDIKIFQYKKRTIQ